MEDCPWVSDNRKRTPGTHSGFPKGALPESRVIKGPHCMQLLPIPLLPIKHRETKWEILSPMPRRQNLRECRVQLRAQHKGREGVHMQNAMWP